MISLFRRRGKYKKTPYERYLKQYNFGGDDIDELYPDLMLDDNSKKKDQAQNNLSSVGNGNYDSSPGVNTDMTKLEPIGVGQLPVDIKEPEPLDFTPPSSSNSDDQSFADDADQRKADNYADNNPNKRNEEESNQPSLAEAWVKSKKETGFLKGLSRLLGPKRGDNSYSTMYTPFNILAKAKSFGQDNVPGAGHGSAIGTHAQKGGYMRYARGGVTPEDEILEEAKMVQKDQDYYNKLYKKKPASPTATQKPVGGIPSTYADNEIASRIYKRALEVTKDPEYAQNLLSIAQHESNFRPSVRNKYGMLGLFQFSPDNQKKYGISISSSVEDQTDAILKYYKDWGISKDNLGVGQLAPGYANRNLIYKKGDRAYEANKGVDINKDGRLTKDEINKWYGINSSFNTQNESRSFTLKNNNVNIKGIDNRLFAAIGGRPVVITSGNDSKHGTNSKHYANKAIDIRIRDKAGMELLNDIVSSGTFVKRSPHGDVYSYNGVRALLEDDHIHLSLLEGGEIKYKAGGVYYVDDADIESLKNRRIKYKLL